MQIRFIENTDGNPPGKLADAEIIFERELGPLSGLRLVGFAVWQRHANADTPFSVTFPSRQYSVNGERRSFALLRPHDPSGDPERLRSYIIAGWEARAEALADGLTEREATAAVNDPRPENVTDDGTPIPRKAAR